MALAQTHIKNNGELFPFQFFMNLLFVLHSSLNTMIQPFWEHILTLTGGCILMLVSHLIFIQFHSSKIVKVYFRVTFTFAFSFSFSFAVLCCAAILLEASSHLSETEYARMHIDKNERIK